MSVAISAPQCMFLPMHFRHKLLPDRALMAIGIIVSAIWVACGYALTVIV